MNGVPLLFALVTVMGVADRQGAPPVADSPFVGEWTANLAKSKQDPNHQISTRDSSDSGGRRDRDDGKRACQCAGQTQHAKETFRTDGTETPGSLNPGVILVARWVGSHVLATIAKKDGRTFGLVTYEVSADGKTLTLRSSGAVEHVIVFERK
jgi:hypothetical protein